MFGFIYRWTNNINDKKYIGSHYGTINDSYIGSGKLFIKAYKKYGLEHFTREILEEIHIDDRKYILEREKYWLDLYNAYYNLNYYNIAKDVMGGDTKAGWDEKRREVFRNTIKQVWANRSPEEKMAILKASHDKNRELANVSRQRMKDWQNSFTKEERSERAKLISERKGPEKRREAAILSAERKGPEKRREAARKGVDSRKPEIMKLAKEKAAMTRSKRTLEEKEKIFQNVSKGRTGKALGSNNGRARKVMVDEKIFNTIRECAKFFNINEEDARLRFKNEKYPNWVPITSETKIKSNNERDND